MAKSQQGDSRLTLGAAGSGKTAPGLAWLLFKGYRKVLEGLGERKQEQEHGRRLDWLVQGEELRRDSRG